jgi:hypothetical protein
MVFLYLTYSGVVTVMVTCFIILSTVRIEPSREGSKGRPLYNTREISVLTNVQIASRITRNMVKQNNNSPPKFHNFSTTESKYTEIDKNENKNSKVYF